MLTLTFHQALVAMASGTWCGRISHGVWIALPHFKPGHLIILILNRAQMLAVATHDACRGAGNVFTCQAR